MLAGAPYHYNETVIGLFGLVGAAGAIFANVAGRLLVTFSGKLRVGHWVGWVVVLAGIGYLVSSEERLQRFLSLSQTDMIVERVEGSVNMSFVEG